MPNYEYRALDQTGSEVSETMEASDETAVAVHLDSMGYFPLNIKEERQGFSLDMQLTKKRVKDPDIVVFSKQLVTLLKAGVPLLSCLEVLSEQTENERLQEVVQKIYVDIESGLSFSEALEMHPDVFSDIYTNSIRAGETGGALETVLERIADLMEHDYETKAKVKSAMRYPMIVVISLVLAFIALMLLVVPTFIELFSRMNVDLPLPTRILIGIHDVIAGYWHVSLVLLAGLYFAFKKYIKTKKGAFHWDQFRIKVPLFGDLNLKTAMSRFTRMFETLNTCGVPIVQTLEITSRTVGNLVISREIERISHGVLEGKGIAEPLEGADIFPPLVVRMISIGEKSGSLDQMLVNVSKHYDSEIEYSVKSLTSMIEPILTVVMGVVVLFLALAIFMPMWDLTKLAR